MVSYVKWILNNMRYLLSKMCVFLNQLFTKTHFELFNPSIQPTVSSPENVVCF